MLQKHQHLCFFHDAFLAHRVRFRLLDDDDLVLVHGLVQRAETSGAELDGVLKINVGMVNFPLLTKRDSLVYLTQALLQPALQDTSVLFVVIHQILQVLEVDLLVFEGELALAELVDRIVFDGAAG